MSQQPQQTLPSAPDSPALVVTSNVQKYAVKKKKVLSAEEAELFELTQAAGITVDQEVFKIIVDLLKMNVAPQAVFQTLKAMCAGQRVAEGCGVGESSTVSHAAVGTTTAPTEARVSAVRSKAGASHSEKSREASSQRVQRQPSATRGQKTKSSGSSSSSSQINST
ncbi:mitotic-spindle organizing protein 2 isoform X3 [Anarrhichthys ocellatus]|uniref:mitotic-spindle organizing protein 2 isoform X3 n=1 Tax=Anarrhichthys ocellatus TaxID=433405 RepID=UPI0012EDBD86|nr:mitotic-spindle organizing protein 2-like isoform X3 [Anarrhichthys ocellatus]